MDEKGLRLAQWLTHELTKRDYDLSTRGGGRTKFASETGISRATISRILAGAGTADLTILGTIADYLGVRRTTILIAAGLLTEEEIYGPRPPITPQQAADELGLTDERERALFLAHLNSLRATRHNP